MPANIDQRIYKTIRDPELEARLKNLYPNAVANPPVEEAQIVDDQGFVPGTNVMPRDVQEKAPKNPLNELKYTEPTTISTNEMPVQDESITQVSGAGVPGFEEYTAGFKMGQEALAAKGAAESEKANALLEAQKQNNDILQKREMEIEEKRRADEEFLAGERRKVEAKQEEYNAKPANIAQLFQDKATGGKIAMGLALFLGAAPNSSGQNKAVQVLSESIKQDLDKQMNEVTGQKGIYNAIKGEFADKEQARQAAYETTMRQLQRQLQIEGAKYDSPLIKANTEAGIAQIQSQIDAARANFDQASMQNILKRQEISQQNMEKFVPGQGFALTKKDAEKTKEYLTDSSNLKSIVSQMKELRNAQGGGEVLNRKAVSDGKQLATQAALIMKNIAELGVLAGPDMKLLNNLIPEDPLSFKPSTMAKLENLEKILKRKEEGFLKQRGFDTPINIEERAKAL